MAPKPAPLPDDEPAPAKTRRDGIVLLNCKLCDDILRLDEDHPRSCVCGSSGARFIRGTWVTSGAQSRLFLLRYEEYDGAAVGLPMELEVL